MPTSGDWWWHTKRMERMYGTIFFDSAMQARIKDTLLLLFIQNELNRLTTAMGFEVLVPFPCPSAFRLPNSLLHP